MKKMFIVKKSSNNDILNSQEENNNNERSLALNNINVSSRNAFILGDSTLFNNIRNTNTLTKFQYNNNSLFEHSFINYQTLPYLTFLQEPKYLENTIININLLINNRKGLEEFEEDYNWEYYELILILAACIMNSDYFENCHEFIMNNLYNGMSKLNEINFSLFLKNNNKFCCQKYSIELKKYLDVKNEDFRLNSTNDYILSQILDKEKFICSSYIYYKLQKEKKLDFTDYKYNKYTIQPLLTAIKFKENLVELNLSSNLIGNEGCYVLGNLLRINKNLSNLTLSCCKIGNSGLQFLLKGLRSNSSEDKYFLTQLNLSDNDIKEREGGEYLGEILKHFNKLNWLNITNNKINNEGAIKFLSAYKDLLYEEEYDKNKKNKNNLETLILFGIGIYSEYCLSLLGDILKYKNCGLKILVLSQNKIGISNSNSSNYNDIQYIKYLFSCLRENKTLNELILLSCQIGNEVIEDIYQMLKYNRYIEYLSLYNNEITQQNSFLKLLSLFCDLPENNGVYNNFLKVLDLSKNNCPIEINGRFLNIIESLQLSSLDISQNKLSKEGSENFKNLANRIGDKLKIIY